jgi:uncharacterized tellurite resistance protein B-like protein
MLQRILDVLRGSANGDLDAPEASAGSEYDRTLAVCALLVEMATIDGEFSPEERERITTVMRDQFGVQEQDIDRVLREAERQARQATSYWQLTRVINANYSPDEKIAIIELLWRVIHADGTVEKHEEYLVRKLAGLLEVSHAAMIAAKLRARPS